VFVLQVLPNGVLGHHRLQDREAKRWWCIAVRSAAQVWTSAGTGRGSSNRAISWLPR